MTEKNEAVCSFCGRKSDETIGLILFASSDDKAKVCNECAAIILLQTKEHISNNNINSQNEKKLKLIPPEDIKEMLDQYVVSQDHAKKILATAIWNHYKMLNNNNSEEKKDITIEKSNIIMVGPTGVGKTELARTIAKFLDVPFAISDCTNLTSSGYVGDDVEQVLRKLIIAANDDIQKAEKGIVFLDEFDKLSRKGENLSITRDVSGEGVQQALLKLLEGHEVEVPPKGGRKHPQQETISINTQNILFICSGSFEGIEKTIRKRQNNESNIGSTIGFGATINDPEKEKSFNELILDLRQDDLKKFGMIPEILGRLPIVCPLQELHAEHLVQILTEPKNALCKQYQELFKADHCELVFEESGLVAIADIAIKRKVGARALRSIMEEILLNDMYTVPKRDVDKIIIDKEYVNKNLKDINTRKEVA